VSWLHEGDDYWVFFNRDERRARKDALPPTIRSSNGIRFVAPTDGEVGGTWFAVNDRAITVCLLNRYDENDVVPAWEPTSRGLLVLSVADAETATEVAERLRRARLDRYCPFTLVAFSPHAAPLALSWDGRALAARRLDSGDMPLVSSSVDAQAATIARRDVLSRFGELTPATLREFHSSHVPTRGALSPCMHRDDASTVSLTVGHVGIDVAELIYQAGSPCGTGVETRVDIPLYAQGRRAS